MIYYDFWKEPEKDGDGNNITPNYTYPQIVKETHIVEKDKCGNYFIALDYIPAKKPTSKDDGNFRVYSDEAGYLVMHDRNFGHSETPIHPEGIGDNSLYVIFDHIDFVNIIYVNKSYEGKKIYVDYVYAFDSDEVNFNKMQAMYGVGSVFLSTKYVDHLHRRFRRMNGQYLKGTIYPNYERDSGNSRQMLNAYNAFLKVSSNIVRTVSQHKYQWLQHAAWCNSRKTTKYVRVNTTGGSTCQGASGGVSGYTRQYQSWDNGIYVLKYEYYQDPYVNHKRLGELAPDNVTMALYVRVI